MSDVPMPRTMEEEVFADRVGDSLSQKEEYGYIVVVRSQVRQCFSSIEDQRISADEYLVAMEDTFTNAD